MNNYFFDNIFKEKKVLITGHTGFKGSWLVEWLLSLGADITGYSLAPEQKVNHYTLLNPEIKSVTADILDNEKLFEVFEQFKPEIVFHMAAQALVRPSYLNPLQTLNTNIMGTANVFEACRKSDSVRAIVNITSDKCYENSEWVWGYRENDPMGGYDPYSVSKGCAELITSSYRNSFFNVLDYGVKHQVLLASVRAGNVIGGGDWGQDRLVPDIMKAASENKQVLIRNPKAYRPWQHVLEPLSGYLMIGQKLLEGNIDFADGWNFGPKEDNYQNVDEVIKRLSSGWSKISWEYPESLSEVHEATLLKLDCSKANLKLNWKPVWGPSKTFEKTVEWYKRFYDKKEIITNFQLEDYIKGALEHNVPWAKKINETN